MIRVLGTLLWLEGRKGVGPLLLLGGSLVLPLLGAPRLRQEAPEGPLAGELLAVELILVALSALAGLILLLAPGRPGAEGWLLLSPPPGWVHQLARFLFRALALLLFAWALAGIAWWASRSMGLEVGLGGLLGLALYGVGLSLPLLALSLLGRTLVLAYALSRLGWLAGMAAFMGTLALFGWFLEAARRVAYAFLPPWPLPGLRFQGTDLLEALPWRALPSEPLVLALLLALGALLLAGRIWDEVEA